MKLALYEQIQKMEVEDVIELLDPVELSCLDENDPMNKIAFNQTYEDEKISLSRDGYVINDDYDTICFGQFVLLEQLIQVKAGVAELLSVFIRPKDDTEFDNTSEKKEALILERIGNMRVGAAYGLLNTIIKQRDDVLFKKYKGVIYEVIDDGSSEEEDEVPNINEAEVQFNKTWFFYERQKILSKELNIPMDKVLMLDIHTCLIEITYQTHKSIIRRNKLKSEKNV